MQFEHFVWESNMLSPFDLPDVVGVRLDPVRDSLAYHGFTTKLSGIAFRNNKTHGRRFRCELVVTDAEQSQGNGWKQTLNSQMRNECRIRWLDD